MNNDIIVSLIGVAGTIIVTLGNVLLTNYLSGRKRNDAQRKNIADGVQCLLRAEIIRSHEKYIDKQFCPIYAKESLTREYNAYHALGGNDVATELYHQLMELPNERRNANE